MTRDPQALPIESRFNDDHASTMMVPDFLAEYIAASAPLGNVASLCCGRNSVQYHQVLIAAEPPNVVGFSDGIGKPVCGGTQNHVACRMSVHVVELLEIHQINEQHSEIATAACAFNRTVETFEDAPSIEQTGEAVVDYGGLQLCVSGGQGVLRFHQFGDV